MIHGIHEDLTTFALRRFHLLGDQKKPRHFLGCAVDIDRLPGPVQVEDVHGKGQAKSVVVVIGHHLKSGKFWTSPILVRKNKMNLNHEKNKAAAQ